MNLSHLNKYYFDEDNKINIIANKILNDLIDNINKDSLKYINYFNKKQNISELCISYYFLINIIITNNEILLDTKNILDGHILNNKYNNLLSEDSILLLFLKLKLFCSKELNNLIPKDNYIQDILLSNINKYENLFDKEDTKLLNKDINSGEKKNLLLHEINKSRIIVISGYLVLSYYFHKFDKKNIDDFNNFILKVEEITDKYLDNSLNTNLDDFWNNLITNI